MVVATVSLVTLGPIVVDDVLPASMAPSAATPADVPKARSAIQRLGLVSTTVLQDGQVQSVNKVGISADHSSL